MWIYKAGDNATGQARAFFPGGGYSTLSVGNGHKEAKWFAENGVTAAVVAGVLMAAIFRPGDKR